MSAITEQTRIDKSIRLGGDNRLGCGHVAVAAAGDATGDFVAVQTIDPAADTVLSSIAGDSGTALTLPAEMVGEIVYMNFTAIGSDKAILVYNRCK